MRKQSIILTLACSIFILMPAAHSMDKAESMNPEIAVSAMPLREEISSDVVLVPLTPLGRAKAASLETYHEEKRRSPKNTILESIRTAEEEENLRKVLDLSITEVSAHDILTDLEESEVQAAMRISLASIYQPRSETDIDTNFNLAQRLSIVDEEYAQRQRQIDRMREKSDVLAAKRESLWEKQRVVDEQIMDIIMDRPIKVSGASSALPLVGGERDDGLIGSLPPIPSHALRSLPTSSQIAAEEDSQVNTNVALKKNSPDEL